MSATYPIKEITLAHPLMGHSAALMEGLEDASQTWTLGAALTFDASGEVKEWTADADDLLGFATAAATGTTGEKVLFWPAYPGYIFEGTLLTDDDDDADDQLAADDQWQEYGLAFDAGESVWYVDKSDETNTRVVVIGLKDAVGTTNGRVYFVVMNDASRFSQSQAT